VIAGDFFRDPIPEGADAVIVANVVHCFAPGPVLDLLRRVRERVSTGARLLLVDFWMDSGHTKPTFAALMAGEFLLTPGGGDVYSADEPGRGSAGPAGRWWRTSRWPVLPA
jgi:hypothetical protein